MKRVPIKGGVCKGLTALFCEIWLWIQSISSFLIFALNLGQNSSLIFGLPRRFLWKRLAMTDKENALCHFTMTAHFVILSVATQRVARRSRSKKIHTLKCKFALWFMDTSLRSVWQDKSVWQGLCHFELSQKAKNPQNLRHALNLRRKIHALKCKFALWFYGYFASLSMTMFCEK